MESFLKDLKHSLRLLRRSPGFTITALAALTLGIGANTAIFSVINTVLLTPVHYRDPDRVVLFATISQSGRLSYPASDAKFNIWLRQTAAFEDVSAYQNFAINLTEGDRPEQLSLERVTTNYFRLAGLVFARGRPFSDVEQRPGGDRVAIISYGLWQRRFGGDPKVVGKVISLGGVPHPIIGILAAGSRTEMDPLPDVWLPFAIDPSSTSQLNGYLAAGRLKPGITFDAAKAQLQLADEEFRRKFPGVPLSRGFAIQPMLDAILQVTDVRSPLRIFLGAVGCVLLIACANVASLLLARATVRKREIAIRSAVGAGRGRIVRQLLAESVVLSFLGGVLGLALGFFGIRALLAASHGSIPRIGEYGDYGSLVTLDWRVLLFTLAVSAITGILFGLLPAIRASRCDLNTTLKENSGRAGLRRNLAGSTLIIGEVSLAVVLLIGAELLIKTFIAFHAVDPGFDRHNVVTLKMSLAQPRFENPSAVMELVREGIRRIDSVPGVESAAASYYLPLIPAAGLPFSIAGELLDKAPHGPEHWRTISQEYFDVFKIPILRGRAFDDRDQAGTTSVVIVNSAMARQYWPHGDPLNGQIVIGTGTRELEEPARKIVGIVGDVRDDGLNKPPKPAMYIPLAQVPKGLAPGLARFLPIVWIVRTRVPTQAVRSAIQAELYGASGGLPTANVRTMDELMEQATARADFNMLILTIFGVSALLLAAIGIYGLMAYTVQQRFQEIGIRMALGAESKNVRAMVVMQGMRLALLGVALGIAGAFGLTRLIDSFLFGVHRLDPLAFTTMPLLLIAVAFLSVWIPARRASRVDPIQALRCE